MTEISNYLEQSLGKSRGIFGESSPHLFRLDVCRAVSLMFSLTSVVQYFFLGFHQPVSSQETPTWLMVLTLTSGGPPDPAGMGWNQPCMRQTLTSAHSLSHYQKVITQYTQANVA